MTPADVTSAVEAAARHSGVSLGFGGDGSYVTPVALRIAGGEKRSVVEVAGAIAERLRCVAGIRSVEVAGNGFLVIRVERPGEIAAEVVRLGERYGRVDRVPRGGWAEWPRTFENPGFCVRYAYARAAGVRRWARDLGISAGEPYGLSDARELKLLGGLGEMPSRARQAARERRADRLQSHLERIAESYHEVYEWCPALPKGDEKPGAVHEARVTLAEATRIALSNGMQMIGEEPRERI